MQQALTREQVRAVDRLAIEKYGMSGLVLMENAGRGVADWLCELGIRGTVVMLCGKGNNGGDAFVIARHLLYRGHNVKLLLTASPAELAGDAAENYRILTKGNSTVSEQVADLDDAEVSGRISEADWIVDALLGTGTSGDPRPPYDKLIALANNASARKLALDLPSGLDCDTGQPGTPTFEADYTATFVAPKTGFAAASAERFLGAVAEFEIGVLRCVLNEVRSMAFELKGCSFCTSDWAPGIVMQKSGDPFSCLPVPLVGEVIAAVWGRLSCRPNAAK